jgi:ArsR family transcriptional regulator
MDVDRMSAHAEQVAPILKALGHPARLLIVLRLLEGSSPVAELETDLGLRQPNLSQHLAALREGGLVDVQRSGRAAVYRLADVARPLIDFLAGGRPVPQPTPTNRRAALECGVFAVTEGR